jgi:hypothetical protein
LAAKKNEKDAFSVCFISCEIYQIRPALLSK